MTIEGNLVDIRNQRIDFGTLHIADGKIAQVLRQGPENVDHAYIMPGFIDAHVHIESSMLVPTEFARMAVCHGTVATVSDPHEIANVLGEEGVLYMLRNAAQSPFKFFFGAPSCVPATSFETAGDNIDSAGIRRLLDRDDIWYLAEMMNFPGVLAGDAEVLQKIRHAQALGKPVDGHAPGLTGADAKSYIDAGIQTDHECVTYDEAFFKLQQGMKIIIREGSAARNFEALFPLIDQFPSMVMLCSDDKHPDDLAVGHINALVRRAVDHGCGLFNALRAACLNPVEHYGLPVGTLQAGDPADFVVVDSLTSFEVRSTVINGEAWYEDGTSKISPVPVEVVNRFDTSRKRAGDFHFVPSGTDVRVIHALDGALITKEKIVAVSDLDDAEADVLKIAVVNRYADVPPALAYIHGFGLRRGAIASSVAHDSHNIVAVGTSDTDLAAAVNAVIDGTGGVVAVDGPEVHALDLPVAGLMSDRSGPEVAAAYTKIDRFVKDTLGSTLTAPFMTLSFMALLVIPALKLSDKGLFDGKKFAFVPVNL